MARTGTYYVGRVLKFGRLDTDKLLGALRNPATIRVRNNAWTFIDVEEYNQSGDHYVFGRLCKFDPDGEVTVVDTVARAERTQIEPNLHVASSPFVFIPAHSGIAYLHVYNHIEYLTFIKRFSEIVKESHQRFFVDCNIELIADLKTFAAKLVALDGIFQIGARVHPPNPLFGPLWESLERYLRERNSDRMSLQENAPEGQTLATELPELVSRAAEQTEEAPFVPERTPAIGDAGILMAADGYGTGTIRGRREGEIIVIKTSETALNFSFPKDPEPHELYRHVQRILENIRDTRHMSDEE